MSARPLPSSPREDLDQCKILEKLPTYPSPNPTFVLSRKLLSTLNYGEEWVLNIPSRSGQVLNRFNTP